MAATDLVAAMGAGAAGNGWARAGANLSGGNLGKQNAYYQGADNGLTLVKKQLEARKLRDEEMARHNLLTKLSAVMPPDQAEAAVALAVSGTGTDFAGGMRGLETGQQMGLQNRVANEPSATARDQLLEAMNGKPVDRTAISGGTAYNPTVAPDAQEMVLTPSAASDDMRELMRVPYQNDRDAASAERSRRVTAGGSGRPVRDPVADHAVRKKIDDTFKRFEDEIVGAEGNPDKQAQLRTQRDAEVASITAAAAPPPAALPERQGTLEDDTKMAVAAWAEDMKLAFGTAPSAPEMEEARQKLARGEPLRVVHDGVITNDGTRPPQVIEPSTGKPVTGGAADKPGNSKRGAASDMRDAFGAGERAAGLPPRMDYEKGGVVGGTGKPAKPATAKGVARPQSQAEYDAIPRGARFIDPDDGKLYTKP